MTGSTENIIARTATNYEELAEAVNGLFTESDSEADQALNRVEHYLQQKVRSVLDGEYPLDSLPLMPATVSALLPKLNEAPFTVDRVYPFAMQDPAVAAEIIRFANEGSRKGSAKPISNPNQALEELAPDTLRSVLTKVMLRPTIPIKPIFVQLIGKPLWDHARDCAQACAELAYENQVDANDAAFIGLTHDVGKLVIFKLLCVAFRATGSSVSPRAAVVNQIVRQYAFKLSRFVAEYWNFPQVYVQALEDQASASAADEMSSLGRTLYYGNLLAEAYAVLQKYRYSGPDLEQALQQLGMSLSRVYDIFPATPRLAYR